MSQTKYDIFISYSRANLEKVKAIKADIEQTTGARCWMDLKDIKVGAPRFTHSIIDGIKKSNFFLFMRSEVSQSSEYALREIHFAVKQGKTVIIVNIDESAMSDEFEFLYGLTDTITWDNSAQRDKLCQNIKEWIYSEGKTMHNGEDPSVDTAKPGETELHIDTDVDCDLFRYKTFIMQLKAGEDNIVCLQPGKYKLRFVSKEVPDAKVTKLYNSVFGVVCDYIEIKLKDLVDEIKRKKEIDITKHKEDTNSEKAEKTKYKKDDSIQESNEDLFQVNSDNLAIMFTQKGKECLKRGDNEYAFSCFRKAAELGFAEAQYNLGYMFLKGIGVVQNIVEAIKWFRKAAEQGYAEAQFHLGSMCQKGRGVPQSDIDAVNWFKKAAEQGNVDAQFRVGYMYLHGRGVPQNATEAMKWYIKAAEHGNASIQSSLAFLYQHGMGITQSTAEAMKWYRKAAEQGDSFAKAELLRLSEQKGKE